MVNGTKVGRPELDGERFPCGKLKPKLSGAELKRILGDAALVAREARLGTEIGRLFAYGKITDEEAASAFEIASIFTEYERVERLSRSARTANLEGGRGAGNENVPADYLERKAKYLFLTDRLAEWPLRARTVVETLCAENRSILSGDPELMASLRALLTALGDALAAYDAEAAKKAKADQKRAAKAKKQSRQEKFESGAYVARAPDATPTATHTPGSAGERDHAALVRELEERQRKRLAAAAAEPLA